MVQNTVHATYTETYDLNTALNEISLLGIHTPQATALKSMFKGFFENYKKYKIVGCNIGMVCASSQSLTPDQVGLEAGSVDPRDVLNPILFKACTGENLNEILNQIYGAPLYLTGNTSSVSQSIDSSSVAINAYYQMLSDDSWRKEHPQRGLFVKGLKPLVHKIVTTQPFRWTGMTPTTDQTGSFPQAQMVSGADPNAGTGAVQGFGGVSGIPASSTTTVNPSNNTYFISDGTVDMPWLDTTFDGQIAGVSSAKEDEDPKSTTYVRCNRMIVSVPRVFCGCIVLPPAILQKLFFRMQIQWHVMFKDFRPAYEVGPIYGTVTYEQYGQEQYFSGCDLGSPYGGPAYWNIYHDSSTKLDQAYSSFDVNGEAEVQQVMESVN